jgi:hypothetical protein
VTLPARDPGGVTLLACRPDRQRDLHLSGSDRHALGVLAAQLQRHDADPVPIAALSANVFQSRSLWMGNLRRARWMPGQLRRTEAREPAA